MFFNFNLIRPSLYSLFLRYDDKNDEVTELYKALPPEMISPWLTTAAELRCYDVEGTLNVVLNRNHPHLLSSSAN